MDSNDRYWQALALFAGPVAGPVRSARRLSVETATVDDEHCSHDPPPYPSQTTSIEENHLDTDPALEWSRVIMQVGRTGSIIETRKLRQPIDDWVSLLGRHRVSREEEEGEEFPKGPKLEKDDCDTMIVSEVSRVQQAATGEEKDQQKQREEMNKERILQLEKENALLRDLCLALLFAFFLLVGYAKGLLLPSYF